MGDTPGAMKNAIEDGTSDRHHEASSRTALGEITGGVS